MLELHVIERVGEEISSNSIGIHTGGEGLINIIVHGSLVRSLSKSEEKFKGHRLVPAVELR